MRSINLRGLSIGLLAAAALALSGPVAADSSDPIKMPIHNWSSQIVGVYIVGKILNEAGYEVDYIPADSQVVYTSMCEGDIDVVHEVWQGAFGVAFEKVVAEGCVIDAATHDAKTREEWWYPSYVEEACPGLPDWEALNACSEQFSTLETAPKGRFLAGPVDWLKHDHERVESIRSRGKRIRQVLVGEDPADQRPQIFLAEAGLLTHHHAPPLRHRQVDLAESPTKQRNRIGRTGCARHPDHDSHPIKTLPFPLRLLRRPGSRRQC